MGPCAGPPRTHCSQRGCSRVSQAKVVRDRAGCLEGRGERYTSTVPIRLWGFIGSDCTSRAEVIKTGETQRAHWGGSWKGRSKGVLSEGEGR